MENILHTLIYFVSSWQPAVFCMSDSSLSEQRTCFVRIHERLIVSHQNMSQLSECHFWFAYRRRSLSLFQLCASAETRWLLYWHLEVMMTVSFATVSASSEISWLRSHTADCVSVCFLSHICKLLFARWMIGVSWLAAAGNRLLHNSAILYKLLCLCHCHQVHRRRDSTESEYVQTNADGQRRCYHQRGLTRAASVSILYIVQ